MRKLNVSYWKFQIVLPHLIIITKEPKTMNTDLNKKNAMDFFRFDEAGKICEHWDSIQQVPTDAANKNGMF